MAGAPNAAAALRRLAERIAYESWFAAIGEPLTDGERADAAAYLAGLGRADCAVNGVADWAGAKAASQDPDWDAAWWDAEERLRRALVIEATEALGEDALMTALSAVTTAASDVVHGAAAIAAARGGIADPALNRVAAGAATQACYQAALARAAGHGDEHPFAAKYRLFAAGRWPLGIVGGTLHVF